MDKKAKNNSSTNLGSPIPKDTPLDSNTDRQQISSTFGRRLESSTDEQEHKQIPRSSHTVTNIDSVKNVVELVGKSFIGLVVFSYALGLLVINIHLNKYGAYSLSLFRLNYITAGLWTLYPILFPSLILIILIIAFFSYRSSDRRHWFLWIFAVGFPIIGLCYFPFIISNKLGMDLWRKEWLITFATGSLISCYCFLIIAMLRLAGKKKLGFVMAIGTILLGLVLFFLHSSSFAYSVYSMIPSHVGGGGTRKVQLVLEAEFNLERLLVENGITFRENTKGTGPNNIKQPVNSSDEQKNMHGNNGEVKIMDQKYIKQTEDVELLLLTEEDYILLGNKGGVSIPKGSIRVIIYVK